MSETNQSTDRPGLAAAPCSAIESAPHSGAFLIWIPSTKLWWPGYRAENGEVFSNAHGVLNRIGDKWSPKATHWMPQPDSPQNL